MNIGVFNSNTPACYNSMERELSVFARVNRFKLQDPDYGHVDDLIKCVAKIEMLIDDLDHKIKVNFYSHDQKSHIIDLIWVSIHSLKSLALKLNKIELKARLGISVGRLELIEAGLEEDSACGWMTHLDSSESILDNQYVM